ncbi:MAG: AraC family transcriptional regulator, partial [Eubacteriales bacterium]|nr:AraC family transcriptional regulator [Eubacteriales bacterium]
MQEKYRPVTLQQPIRVERLHSIHYFQFARGYVFPGESHDFWELVYLDKGMVELGADGQRFLLGEGEMAFHQPNEFHSIWAGGKDPPDIVVLSFVCTAPQMQAFARRRMPMDNVAKQYISTILREARGAFYDIDGQYRFLRRREESRWGAEQMVKNQLECLLIHLLRNIRRGEAADGDGDVRPKTKLSRQEYQAGLVQEIVRYMQGHLSEDLRFDDLCRSFRISATALKKLFAEQTGRGAIEYLGYLRMEQAKRYMRGGLYNMGEIAQLCGFKSLHYFSRRFKQQNNMTPTQ